MSADSADGGDPASDAGTAASTLSTTGDSTAATIGFVLAGVVLAASFLDWTPVVAMYGIPSLPGLLTAGIAFVVMLGRRHGAIPRSASAIALGGFIGVIASGAAALLLPGLDGSTATSVGIGVYLAMLAGVVGIGVAYADYTGIPNRAFSDRIREGLIGTGIGFGGFVFGILVASICVSLLAPFVREYWLYHVQTAAFSLGLGAVAIAYAIRQPSGLDYFDIRMPDRRGWLYVVGGTVAMFVLLIAGGVISSLLNLPSAQHGLMKTARDTPSILLPLIPLGYLAIGPSEELLNRNVVQKHLYGGYSRYGAVLVATFIFTIIHVPAYGGIGAAPGALLVTLIRLFLVSLVLGVVYERTNNIVVAAIIHGNFDAIQFGAAYILITQGMV